MAETEVRIITRGDDCGSSKTANQAILECVEKGILKNVSLMACCDSIEDAATMLAGKKDICFGVHATMNAEWDHVRWGPVLSADQVPSLVDERGHFFQTVRAFHEHGPILEEVMAELQAQLDRLRALGFPIAYADMHMGFSWAIEGFDVAFDEWCKREGLVNAIPYYRNGINSLHKHMSDEDPIPGIIQELDQLPPGQYLTVGHPAYDNEEMRALGHEGYPGEQVAIGRHWERLMYSDPRVVEFVKAKGIKPIRYDEAHI